MELFDVIVIGAGPAGATAARSLSSEGLSVLVMERHSFPRPKPCAGWISPWALEMTGVTPDRYGGDGRTLVPFGSLIVWDSTDVPRLIDFGRVMGFGILRSEFDAFLAARMGSARLIEGARAVEIRRNSDGVVVDGFYGAPILIGAGGHRCPAARAFGSIRPDERFVTAVVSETRVGRAVIERLTPYPDVPQIIFNGDFSGYGWYFPKGDYLNIGVGTTSAPALGLHRDALMARLGRRGMLPDPDHCALAPFVGHAYKLMRVSPRCPSTDRVLLAGDAAGVAYNMSGEGIGPAIFSGLTAASTVIEAAGDYSSRSLDHHSERLRERLGKPYPDRLVSAVSLAPRFLNPIARRIAVGSGITRRLVARRWFFRD
jgi:flavin-dependent dehydrogenase